MKKLAGILVTLILVFTVCCCACAETEVSIWHTFTEGQQAALQEICDGFNASQSEYKAVLYSQAYSGFTDSVFQATANGTGPSIIFNYGSEAAKYVPDEKVVNLKPYIYDSEIGMVDVYESLPEALRSEVEGFEKEGIYYLPCYTTGPVLFYNTAIYDEMGFQPPKTWEELAE